MKRERTLQVMLVLVGLLYSFWGYLLVRQSVARSSGLASIAMSCRCFQRNFRVIAQIHELLVTTETIGPRPASLPPVG